MEEAWSSDLTVGRSKVETLCQTCHGMDGIATTTTVPNIAGQQMDYLVIQLEAYRSGKREHPQMTIVSQNLTDEDIENVSHWYASIKFSVEMPE